MYSSTMMTIVALLLFLLVVLVDITSALRSLRARSMLRMSVSSTANSPTSSDYKVISNNGIHTLSFEVAGKTMSFETGKIGRQASGAAVARTGDTMVYSTVCNEREAVPMDFTPLRVDYFARYSAVGQTIGAFHRRDSRGDDNEILVARLIDRPIRPMIRDGWQHDTQVLAWVLSYDKTHPIEALAICAASAAMSISEVPMIRPVAGVEVGLIDGKLMVNPTVDEMKNSTLKLTLAGTKSGILMIEGAANFLPEEMMIEALSMGHQAIGTICDAIAAFQAIAGKEKKLDTLRKLPDELLDSMDTLFGDDLTKALSIGDKHKRGAAVGKVEEKIAARFVKELAPEMVPTERKAPSYAIGETFQDDENLSQTSGTVYYPDDSLVVLAEDEDSPTEINGAPNDVAEEDEASELKSFPKQLNINYNGKEIGYNYDTIDVKIATKKLLVRKLRQKILTTGQRSDGRRVNEVRPLYMETSLLPNAHGSSLFTRGETQALATATLGSKAMEAKYETLDELSAKKFYLQYRFPPSSVGEVGRVGGTNRREVGHGNLAERALIPAIPSSEDFPYSIRAESLITESCGSSSMATVCGCCLAMLDAGVPLKSSVAGVAMGLILGEKEGDEPVVLTDILGLEDALGTMDFKVAGNETGITTFQLDIKSEGLTLEILVDALKQAKEGRLIILNQMKSALSEPRPLKDTIPKIMEFKINPDALGKVIGPKGKTVQTLIETHGVININLQDDGTIQIESFSFEKNEDAKAAILAIAEDAMKGGKGGKSKDSAEKPELGPPPEEGMIYKECEIKGIHAFGVFVEILPGYEGLVHVSELDLKKIPSPEKAGYVVGQKLDVKYLGKNEKGQMRLSRRAVLMRDAEVPSAISSGDVVKTIASRAEDAYSS